MSALLCAWLLALPIYPVNPVQQDTIPFMSTHFTVGVTAPNGIVTTGIELSSKYEMLLFHPLMIRGCADYRFGTVNAKHCPHGLLHGPTFSLEILCYRGTNISTGFIGAGIVFTKYDMNLNSNVADSLRTYHEVTDVTLRPTTGYRMTMGLRFRRVFSIEIAITDVRPDFLYRRDLGPGRFSERSHRCRFNDFRVSLGFLVPIKRFQHGP